MPDSRADGDERLEKALGYTPIFDPSARAANDSRRLEGLCPYSTSRKPLPYVYGDPEIALAVNVALATNRPLLLSGRPGCGKSSLARDVADGLKWEYLEETITSRTQANDLLWKFDSLQRLSDASNPKLSVKEEAEYVRPGVLWWAFDPASAYRATRISQAKKDQPEFQDVKGIVVLIDEIDKAEPDVPNDLLVPLSEGQFQPRGHDEKVPSTHSFLLCITTNGERELPQAFLRRCVTLSLKRPNIKMMRKIALAHNENLRPDDEVLTQVLATFESLEKEMLAKNHRPPSIAEFLDAIEACLKLKPNDFDQLSSFVMRKIVEIRDPEH